MGLSPAVPPSCFLFLFSRPLTHLTRRLLVIYYLGLAYIKSAPGLVKRRHLRSILPLLSICVISGLPATAIWTADPPTVLPSIRVRFVFLRRSHRPRRPRCFVATPEKLLTNRLATLTFFPRLNLPSPAQFSFARSRSIRDCDLFLSCLFPNSQLAIPV